MLFHVRFHQLYFNPHSPCGERPCSSALSFVVEDFNPHSPCGERPRLSQRYSRSIHFNPHSPCGERPVPPSLSDTGCSISIHTPHAGSDEVPEIFAPLDFYFNPHSPCGERLHRYSLPVGLCHFNPHSPCGERPCTADAKTAPVVISIHTPHAGATTFLYHSNSIQIFQSTLPMRGATTR